MYNIISTNHSILQVKSLQQIDVYQSNQADIPIDISFVVRQLINNGKMNIGL